MLRVTVAVAVVPRESVAAPLTICPTPSAVTETGWVHETICGATPAASGSAFIEHAKPTVTSVRFQTLALGGGATAATIVGVESSFRIVIVMVFAGLLFSSTPSVLFDDSVTA